jgi:response regulator NasT
MLSSLRILVADDDADSRAHLQGLLTRLGHQVAVAATGKQLIELARQSQPDLVLLDVHLPGLDAAGPLNGPRAVPVILVAASSDPGLLSRARSGPVMACLLKPVKAGELEAALTVAWLRFEEQTRLRQEAANLRQALEERKLADRAKGIVMERLRVGEQEAYHLIRKAASDGSQRLTEVAERILRADEVFRALEGKRGGDPSGRGPVLPED